MARPTVVFEYMGSLDSGINRIERYWFHVPRVGDIVHLNGLGGVVKTVIWSDDYVTVTFGE